MVGEKGETHLHLGADIHALCALYVCLVILHTESQSAPLTFKVAFSTTLPQGLQFLLSI